MLKEDELTYKIRGCVFKRWSQPPVFLFFQGMTLKPTD